LRTHQNGEEVLDGGFRRRDADGGDRDGHAPGEVANDRGALVIPPEMGILNAC
jgi:hypothetical protein